MWRFVFLGIMLGLLGLSWWTIGWWSVPMFYLFVGFLIWLIVEFDTHWSIVPLWPLVIASNEIRDWYTEL